MKKLLFVFALIIGSFNAFSQNQGKLPMTAEEKADETVSKMKPELQLTDDQVAKVKTATVEKINKVTAAHKKAGADKNKLQASNKLIMEEYEKQLQTILTEEQYKKYLASKGQK